MNSERNPHLLSDPSGCGGGSGGGCVIGSSSGPPIHGYGSPQGSGVDMQEPLLMANHVQYQHLLGSNPQFPQQHLSTHHLQQQQQQQHHQRSFYGSTNYNSCASNNSANSSNDSSGAGVHTTMNQIRGNQNSYCNTNSNAISSSTNNGIFYESAEVVDQSQYYHQQQQQQQPHHHSHNNSHNQHHQQQHHHHHFHHQQQHFDNNMHLQKTGSSTNSCASLENNVNLSGECVGGDGGASGTNFYGFYNQSGQYGDYHQQQHHHQHHSQHHHDGVYNTAGDGSGVNRMHHQYYRQEGSSSGSTDTSANSVPVGHPNYFNSNIPTQNYPAVSGTSSTPPTRYGSPMIFPNNHSHQQQQQQPNTNYGTQQLQQQQQHPHHQNNMGQIPIRRNSIESFSSEPGDNMHSSYTARYGCSSTTNMNHPQLQQISNHNMFPTSGESTNTSGMVKRECMSAGGNVNDTMTSRGSPSINPMTPNSTPTSWSPHPPQGGYFPSSSPSNSCTSSSSPNPCSTNTPTPTIRTTFINSSYPQAGQSGVISGESANCRTNHGNFYSQQQHHQQQHPTQFKSCAYEQSQQHHDIKDGIQLVQSNSATNSLKAASAVKHRSLSLSMPLPSYLENNGSSRSELDGNFVNHHHRQIQHHHHHNHGYNPMMDGSQHHQQCTTTGGLIPPDQNLLTPNSDDDMPFRTASAGGQSDLDSSYETMGDEGCSSSTSASHCMPMNTSGNSACSGSGDNNNGSSMTPDLHSMSIDTNEPDCHHHHHHNHHNNDLPFSTSGPSCMQNHVQTSLSMGMLEIPNSTVALCTTNVDDLDDSSSDSSDELHNVISAVVENSSIETPENTMMGDEDDDDVIGQGEGNGDDNCPSESGGDVNRVVHYHHTATPDNQTDVNVISTTTTDDVDNDNCSESSMNNINSSFTADMFSSNDNGTGLNKNGSGSDKDGIDSNSFACIPEGTHFDEDDDEDNDDDDNASVNSSFSLQLKSCSNTTSSFSETDKDNVVSATTTTTSLTFGASFRTNCAGSGSGSSTSISGIGGGGSSINDKCAANNDSESSANSKNSSSCSSANNGNGMGNNSATTTTSSSCKAIGIIISSSNSNIITSDANGNRVSIPKGWKREILKGSSNENNGSNNNTSGVLYISGRTSQAPALFQQFSPYHHYHNSGRGELARGIRE
ncbi:hypothetical protein Ocin01_04044 [Orchesella cincta]|uniref:Uncharacterized protein n=1 Tax=Orchesella cincta TaxID=48709 RepID=A0A1D2NC34_ORCCI|nr:hypothetical protein Ocin01_04044 [Orchesella cincta]